MNPFSAFTFIRKNKARCAVIILMMSMTMVSCFAELFADNSRYAFEVSECVEMDRVICVKPKSGSRQVLDSYEGFADHAEDHAPSCAKTVLYADFFGISFKDALDMDLGTTCYSFYSSEDMDLYRERLELPKHTIGRGEMIITRLLADTWGVKEGDVVCYEMNKWEFAGVFEPTKIVKIIDDEPGYRAYRVSLEDEPSRNPCVLMIADKIPGSEAEQRALASEMNKAAGELGLQYPLLQFSTSTSTAETTAEMLSVMYLILYSVIVLFGIVLAITINATFVALYDKRRYEFAIYRALGMSTGKIFRKFLAEILTMNGLGILFGAVVTVAGVIILDMNFRRNGIRFFYPSYKTLLPAISCDLIVLVPVIFLNWLRVRKNDVTQY